MARKSRKKKGLKQESDKNQWLWVDPARVRFQHSRIRPSFSGCGRSVEETLESIRKQELAPSDLPPIQVIVGPEDHDGPWYFSLNNRRLWVFKRCREEGLLENNVIRVRVREPKSGSEEARYSLENCSVEAKFIREKAPNRKNECNDVGGDLEVDANIQGTKLSLSKSGKDSLQIFDPDCEKRVDTGSNDNEDEATDTESDDNYISATPNPFSALM